MPHECVHLYHVCCMYTQCHSSSWCHPPHALIFRSPGKPVLCLLPQSLSISVYHSASLHPPSKASASSGWSLPSLVSLSVLFDTHHYHVYPGNCWRCKSSASGCWTQSMGAEIKKYDLMMMHVNMHIISRGWKWCIREWMSLQCYI